MGVLSSVRRSLKTPNPIGRAAQRCQTGASAGDRGSEDGREDTDWLKSDAFGGTCRLSVLNVWQVDAGSNGRDEATLCRL